MLNNGGVLLGSLDGTEEVQTVDHVLCFVVSVYESQEVGNPYQDDLRNPPEY